MIKAGIVGATGYTGSELLRILVGHPHVEVHAVCSRSDAGRPVVEMFPNLRGFLNIDFCEPSAENLKGCDVIFFATPHGVAQAMMSDVLASGARVIDLSADFRIKDQALWEKWYQQAHNSPELIDEAVYGLPEVNRDKIADTRLLACPGCYPTAIQLGLIPLIENGLVNVDQLIADAKSGVSGAGRKASVGTLLSECADSFKAYGISGHRHRPEIEQGLSWAAGKPVSLTFVPHLVPMIRGIEATLYAPLNEKGEEMSLGQVQALFEERYQGEAFVDVMPSGSLPETRSVKGSNICRLAIHQQEGSNMLIISSVIDNLVKGASGQAVQNMNIMFGFEETCGLQQVPLSP
ncbi:MULTISPECIES: N-acetyl-gamma-glutamyl-phosphate reductase [unclassified Oleiphilus]|uniref:N-acetyl-gamma-glutamyl-phosphate reductase n=1 Tax=unclassified Oleiphilus TaxID=2631174 RepID=UPI0007C25C5C|nr:MULTISPECIES: N-acetyl-gamma-glutamyl-phosphate reductase [unclassified Oleiphilus]KZY63458.1 N-acetyl-gamma-glutamyl-phosphate reductase [Oleiphilus sp. HI0066]KZY70883.1 N-acetyl-gamma-glutamyl-phosphate reductase [Oleiphilus sp. HI0067]